MDRVADTAAEPTIPLTAAAKRLAHRLLAIGENRLHLLVVEVEEERDRMIDMMFMAIVAGVLGMLVGIAWSAAIVVFFWPYSPLLTLVILGAVYAACAAIVCKRLVGLRGGPHTFTATLNQLKKDRACLH